LLEDEKVAFYFRNRSDIEEWASLRTWAAVVLAEALSAARDTHADDPDFPGLIAGTPWGDGAILPIPGRPVPGEAGGVGVGLEWGSKYLLKADGPGGPWLVLITEDPKASPQYKVFKEATRDAAARHHMTQAGDKWAWKTQLVAPSGAEDLSTYAEGAMERLRAAWVDLQPAVAKSLG
jgi:hypothetical protein